MQLQYMGTGRGQRNSSFNKTSTSFHSKPACLISSVEQKEDILNSLIVFVYTIKVQNNTGYNGAPDMTCGKNIYTLATN